MIPSRGFCHSCFLLGYAGYIATRHDVESWVSATRSLPTVMAAALGLNAVAAELLRVGLARLGPNGLAVDPRLIACGEDANSETFTRIARLLLEVEPPAWLPAVVRDGIFRSSGIPAADERELGWLSEHLGPMLESLAPRQDSEEFLRAVGRIGEEVVLEAERRAGRKAVHVASISDRYGYDVESHDGSRRRRIEVKTAFPATAHRLFLSRNEASVAARLPDEWCLVQVTLSPSIALTLAPAAAEDVLAAREVAAPRVLGHLIADTPSCRWVDRVEVSMPNDAWERYAPTETPR